MMHRHVHYSDQDSVQMRRFRVGYFTIDRRSEVAARQNRPMKTDQNSQRSLHADPKEVDINNLIYSNK